MIAGQNSSNLSLGGMPVLQYLAHGGLDLKFDIPFQWNIDELSTFVANWLSHDYDAPRASMVGIMSSASLLRVICDLVGSDLAQIFKALVSTSSMIFNSSNGNLLYTDQSTDIKVLRHCGHKLLQHLDAEIRPTSLARLTRQELCATFLLLLGCIIASKYVDESLGDLSQLGPNRLHTINVLRSQPSAANSSQVSTAAELIRLLSHQLMFIGQTTGLLQEASATNLILALTSSRWRRPATMNSIGQSSFLVTIDTSYSSSMATSFQRSQSVSEIHTTKRRRRKSRSPSDGAHNPPPIRLAPVEPDSISDRTRSSMFGRQDSTSMACEQNSDLVQPPSPLDFSIAAFDPDLPSFGAEDAYMQGASDETWAFLNQIPSPSSVDTDHGFEQQWNDFGGLYTTGQDFNTSCGDTARRIESRSQFRERELVAPLYP